MREAAVAFGAVALAPWLVLFAACSSDDPPPSPAAEAAPPDEAAAGEDAPTADGGSREAEAEAEAAAPLACDGAVICEDFETDPFASRWTLELDPGGTMPWVVGGAPASPGHAAASIVPSSEARMISAVAKRSFDVGASGLVDLRVDVRIDTLIESKPVLAIAGGAATIALVIGPSSATVLRASLQVTTSAATTLPSTTLFPAPASGWMQIGISLDTTKGTASASVPDGGALTADQVSFGTTSLSVRIGVENADEPSTTRVAFDDVVVESP